MSRWSAAYTSGSFIRDSSTQQRRFHLPGAQGNLSQKPIADFLFGIDAKSMKQTRSQILGSNRLIDGKRSKTIGSANHAPAGLRAARDDERIATRPVISPRFIDAIARELPEPRRSSEFTHADDERAIQQAALVQIFQKRGEALVKRRQKLFLEPAVVVEVRVPVWTRVIDSATPINGDEPHAGFDESSCQEETLCVFMSAVAISNPVRLRANIKSPARCFRGQQREGALLMLAQILDPAIIGKPAQSFLDCVQERLSIC